MNGLKPIQVTITAKVAVCTKPIWVTMATGIVTLWPKPRVKARMTTRVEGDKDT